MSTFAQLQKLSKFQPELVPMSKKASAKKKRKNKIQCMEEIAETWHAMVFTAKHKAKLSIGQYDCGFVATEECHLACSFYPGTHHALKVIFAYNTRGLSFYRWYLDDQCEGCTDG